VSEQARGRARTGDGWAFGGFDDPYRRELRVPYYRILGSVQDAEDVLKGTLLAAWRGLGKYEGRAALRAWLYRIATSRRLNAPYSEGRPEGRRMDGPPAAAPPEPTRLADPVWLEPYPDVLLDGLPEMVAGSEARYGTEESISLAFVAALHHLPPRQRATLLLRDVLGFDAAEVADILECSQSAVTSALRRARVALEARLPDRESAPLHGSAREHAVVGRFVDAFERGDVDRIVGLLTDDVWITMPPLPFEYQGPGKAARFLSLELHGAGREFRLVATGANGQPAFGCYVREAQASIAHAHGLMVLTILDERISAVTHFLDNSFLSRFGLPRTLCD
jgi:RNA polymerase sigma-70 factor (TIGR02960 family)